MFRAICLLDLYDITGYCYSSIPIFNYVFAALAHMFQFTPNRTFDSLTLLTLTN